MSPRRLTLRARSTGILVVAALILTSAGSAAAGSLITSKQIKNGTIRNVDVHANTIKSNKIHDGAIKTRDLSGAAVSQLNTTWEWTPSYVGTGSLSPDGDSARVFPGGTKITFDHALLSGDFSTCPGHVQVLVYLKKVSDGTAGSPLLRWDMASGTPVTDMKATTTPTGSVTIATDSYLNVQGGCDDASLTPNPLPMPSFSLNVGVAWPDTWN